MMSRNHTPPAPSALRCLLVWATLTLALGSVAWLCLSELLLAVESPHDRVAAEQSVVLVACVAGVWASGHVWVVATGAVLDSLRGRAALDATLPATTASTGTPTLGGHGAHLGVSGTAGAVRRLTLLACGAAVSAGATLPAYAAEPAPRPSSGELQVLDGLPYPDRATSGHVTDVEDVPVLHPGVRERGPAATTRGLSEAPGDHARGLPADERDPTAARRTVRPGDSLWAIAAELTASSDVARVADRADALHRANRHVIGDDPDLILPGQRLEVATTSLSPTTRPPGTTSAPDHTSRTDRPQEGPR